jgi:hypothetical protein
MNRRTTVMLTGVTLLGLAVAGAQPAFAQSNLPTGVWLLNVAKSKYSPGPPPKAQISYYQGEGQIRTNTVIGIDAEGKPTVSVFMHIYDGQPHATTGNPAFDSSIYTRVDANTIRFSRLKGRDVVQTGTQVTSPDGKTYTTTTIGTDERGRQINNVGVSEKQ